MSARALLEAIVKVMGVVDCLLVIAASALVGARRPWLLPHGHFGSSYVVYSCCRFCLLEKWARHKSRANSLPK